MAFEDQSPDVYDKLGQAISATVNVEEIEDLARKADPLPVTLSPNHSTRIPRSFSKTSSLRIGVAYDSAFCFYYQENLRVIEELGAQLVFFSPLTDAALPPVDLLYVGSGYPELYSEAFFNNVSMRQSIKDFAVGGGVVYAECGGLMFLMDSIEDFDGGQFAMVGIFPFVAKMDRLTMRIGYRDLEIVTPCILGKQGITARGHEFHYFNLIPLDVDASVTYACSISE